MKAFQNNRIKSWIFDLDNTLYPAECNLFAQIDQRMGAFIAELLDVDLTEARRVQKDYYFRYGTTLNGLMQEHQLDPHRYLDYVHDIDHSVLPDLPDLRLALEKIEGEKFIFTNGSKSHGEQVAGALGILDQFSAVFDISAADFTPKPHSNAYDRFIKSHNIQPHEAVMFEDLHPNLRVPYELGMTTVLVNSSYDDHPSQKERKNWQDLPNYIHYETDNLANFLNAATAVAS